MPSNYDDQSVFKHKIEYIDMYDKICNKINIIKKVNNIIIKTNNKLKKNVLFINSYVLDVPSSLIFFTEGPERVYKINARIDDLLNFVWFVLYKKNRKNRKSRISSDEVNTDKLKLLKKMLDLSYDIRHQTFSKILVFHLKSFLLYETDMDDVRLLHSEIKKFMIQLKQNLNMFNKENLL